MVEHTDGPAQGDQTKKGTEGQDTEEAMEQDKNVSQEQSVDDNVDKGTSDQSVDTNTQKPCPNDMDNRTHSSNDQVEIATDKIPDSSTIQDSNCKTHSATDTPHSSAAELNTQASSSSTDKTQEPHSQTLVSSEETQVVEDQLNKVSGHDNVSNNADIVDKSTVPQCDSNIHTEQSASRTPDNSNPPVQSTTPVDSSQHDTDKCVTLVTIKSADTKTRDGDKISSVTETDGATVITQKSETCENVVENTSVAKPSDRSVQTVEMKDVGNTAIENDDAVSLNAGESESISDSSSGTGSDEDGDAAEDVEETQQQQEKGSDAQVSAEGDAQPVNDELEMLELELRARAIRSLMKKMGKD